MRTTFRLKTLVVAIATFSVASVASAAGLDRSGQDVTAFFQDGLYAEAVYTYIDADVSGYDSSNNNPGVNTYERGNATGDISEDYDFFRYGVKADINDTFSVGILYDEPFGAAAEYSGDNNFVAQDGDNRDATISAISGGAIGPGGPFGSAAADFASAAGTVNSLQNIVLQGGTLTSQQQSTLTSLAPAVGIAQAEFDTQGEGTNVEVRSQNLTAILGMKLGGNKNFQIYGGPVAQRIEAQVRLRGLAYGPATGYTSNSNPDMDYGYIAGVSYNKPEIALKAALTYRSEIDHDLQINENYPLAGTLAGNPAAAIRTSNYEITTPESVNFDFQTGLNPTTLATAKVRWVPWSDFVITPPLYNDVSKRSYGPDGLNLVEYEDDQWQVEVGLAKRVAPALAVSGTVGWDSGAGDPVTSLGPIEGYYSVGLGAKYNVTKNWAVSAGGKYLWFGDAKGQLPSDKIVGDFQDNDGYIVGVKLSYQAMQNFN
ncbi:OmpP1/FadL family transporter [Psychrobacter sp. LV10R520-6]|uniref:OmpP1/FadL family transporter n=1 Tax=Psychrobacter sp. LV10R520-6 TaxID=1415574 RepID=UPI0024C9A614|nr:outer membrane protein transport protein [Psychrobacter sp. LV10R520-6]SNT70121.1 long-chain fatty acid transport protein [Psychrobacter sp. LV10R520-6]